VDTKLIILERSRGVSFSAVMPFHRISPPKDLKNPAMVCSKVLLPIPLRPIRAIISPPEAEKVIPSRVKAGSGAVVAYPIFRLFTLIPQVSQLLITGR